MYLNQKQIEEIIKRVKQELEETKKVHTPYAETMKKVPDFEVSYEILPDIHDRFNQGARCDFLYEGDHPWEDGIHMIWPEFLDDKGNVILDKTIQPQKKGHATMWILSHDSRVKFHRARLKVGTKGHWVTGSRKIAKVTVTKILGLFENEA